MGVMGENKDNHTFTLDADFQARQHEAVIKKCNWKHVDFTVATVCGFMVCPHMDLQCKQNSKVI